MEEPRINKPETTNEPTEDGKDFIQAFIERKKLQNRILQEIIDNLNKINNEQNSKINHKKK